MLTALRYYGMWPPDSRSSTEQTLKLYKFYSGFLIYLFIHVYTLFEVIHLIFYVEDMDVSVLSCMV